MYLHTHMAQKQTQNKQKCAHTSAELPFLFLHFYSTARLVQEPLIIHFATYIMINMINPSIHRVGLCPGGDVSLTVCRQCGGVHEWMDVWACKKGLWLPLCTCVRTCMRVCVRHVRICFSFSVLAVLEAVLQWRGSCYSLFTRQTLKATIYWSRRTEDSLLQVKKKSKPEK